MYISSIPGRIRFRTDDQTVLRRLAEAVGGLPGVVDVRINERTGSLLVQYENTPEAASELEILLKDNCPTPGNPGTESKAVAKAAYMRIAKRGMLSSLGLALLFALLDREDGHIFSGAMFLGFLSYHLYGYRKRVLA